MSEAKLALREANLEAQRELYSDLASDWRLIEEKAKGTTAIASVFLAAVFAFVRWQRGEDAISRRVLVS